MVIEFLVFLLRVGFKSDPKEKPHEQKMVLTIIHKIIEIEMVF